MFNTIVIFESQKQTKSYLIMKNSLTRLASLVLLLSAVVLFSSCNKNEDPDPQGTADFNVSLKSTSSSRTSYDSINIDIQQISIHTSTDSSSTSGWFDLETNTGIYDLIDYTSGNDTILALDSLLEVQTVSQIRLLLGENNTIVLDSISYDLETPSAQTSGIKIQVHAELQPNTAYKVVLNFNADESIIETGNGKFKLKPVIDASVIEF